MLLWSVYFSFAIAMYYWLTYIYGNWSDSQSQQLSTSNAVQEGRFKQAGEQQVSEPFTWLISFNAANYTFWKRPSENSQAGQRSCSSSSKKKGQRARTVLAELLPCLQLSSCFRASLHLKYEEKPEVMSLKVSNHTELHRPCKQCQFLLPAPTCCSMQSCAEAQSHNWCQ